MCGYIVVLLGSRDNSVAKIRLVVTTSLPLQFGGCEISAKRAGREGVWCCQPALDFCLQPLAWEPYSVDEKLWVGVTNYWPDRQCQQIIIQMMWLDSSYKRTKTESTKKESSRCDSLRLGWWLPLHIHWPSVHCTWQAWGNYSQNVTHYFYSFILYGFTYYSPNSHLLFSMWLLEYKILLYWSCL